MSTIDPLYAQNRQRAQPPSPDSRPQPCVLTPEHLSHLLRSGPTWSVPPKRPDQPAHAGVPLQGMAGDAPSPQEAMAAKDLNELSTRLNKQDINQILRNPGTRSAQQTLAKLHQLSNQANLRAMLSGPDAQSNANTLEAIGRQLGKGQLTPMLDSLKHEATRALMDRVESSKFDALSNIFDEDNFDVPIERYLKSKNDVNNVRGYVSQMEQMSQALSDVGASLAKDKLDALHKPAPNSASPADNDQPGPKTYSFNTIYDAAREVRDFNRQDTLDLSGIRTQLNRPLKWVEHFGGASAEMQIHYLPSTHTSVIAIAGNPGEPPFVIRVSGEVRYSNLVT